MNILKSKIKNMKRILFILLLAPLSIWGQKITFPIVALAGMEWKISPKVPCIVTLSKFKIENDIITGVTTRTIISEKYVVIDTIKTIVIMQLGKNIFQHQIKQQ